MTNTAVVGSAVNDPTPGNNTSTPVITTLINARAGGLVGDQERAADCQRR